MILLKKLLDKSIFTDYFAYIECTFFVPQLLMNILLIKLKTVLSFWSCVMHLACKTAIMFGKMCWIMKCESLTCPNKMKENHCYHVQNYIWFIDVTWGRYMTALYTLSWQVVRMEMKIHLKFAAIGSQDISWSIQVLGVAIINAIIRIVFEFLRV